MKLVRGTNKLEKKSASFSANVTRFIRVLSLYQAGGKHNHIGWVSSMKHIISVPFLCFSISKSTLYHPFSSWKISFPAHLGCTLLLLGQSIKVSQNAIFFIQSHMGGGVRGDQLEFLERSLEGGKKLLISHCSYDGDEPFNMTPEVWDVGLVDDGTE